MISARYLWFSSRERSRTRYRGAVILNDDGGPEPVRKPDHLGKIPPGFLNGDYTAGVKKHGIPSVYFTVRFTASSASCRAWEAASSRMNSRPRFSVGGMRTSRTEVMASLSTPI